MLHSMVQSLQQSLKSHRNWLGLRPAAPLPDRLLVKPLDMWSGQITNGDALAQGMFHLRGQSFQLHGGHWYPPTLSPTTRKALHSFIWLRDLRAAAHASARQQARALFISWVHAHPKQESWIEETSTAGQRLSLWLSHYDFMAIDGEEDFDEHFFRAALKQTSLLIKAMIQGKTPPLTALKGAMIAAYALPGFEDKQGQLLARLPEAIKRTFYADGLHRSRSPQATLDSLADLLDLRGMLQSAGQDVPVAITDIIPHILGALRILRYGDRALAVMQGSSAGDIAHLNAVVSQAGMRAKPKKTLEEGAFSKAQHARTALLLDHGAVTRYQGHHAPLSFELAHGKERVFVNCGTHPHDENWQHILASAPAHNCALIEELELPAEIAVTLDQAHHSKEQSYFQASHHGYMKAAGITQTRSLYIGDDGNDVRGEESWTSDLDIAKPYTAIIRFHMHPRVIASLTEDHQSVLMRLPGGVGWHFRQSGAHLTIEESIYAGHQQEAPRKTQQIVLRAPLTPQGLTIKWAMQNS